MDRIELWLVRHGETKRSARREIAGWSDPPLTARGRAEAAAVAGRLARHSFTSVWSSDLSRARESAALAGFTAVADARLRELNFGRFEGRPFTEIGDLLDSVGRRFRGFSIPEGESREAFQQRIEAFLAELQPGRHLLFVHGGVIRAITQDLGVDRFVVTGSVVGVDWTHRQVLFVDEPADAKPVFEPEASE